MSIRMMAMTGALLLTAVGCLADEYGFTAKSDSMRALADGAGFSCTNCELKLRPNQALRFAAGRIRSDTTGTVQLDDRVSVELAGGTLRMEHATLSTGPDGQQRLVSPELRFIPFGRH